MSRLIDRCLMLAAGAAVAVALGGHGSAENLEGGGPAAGASSATAPPDDAADAGRMEALVDEVVGLRPDRTGRQLAPLTDDEIDRCLVVARDIDPPLYDGLTALRTADPDEFRTRLARSHRLRFLADLRQDEPHLYELKLIELRTDREVARLSGELAAAARRGEDDVVADLRPQLVAQMRMQQAFILLARKQTLDRMREKLDTLEQAYQEDLSTVDERIQEIVERLVRGDAVDEASNRAAATTVAPVPPSRRPPARVPGAPDRSSPSDEPLAETNPLGARP